MSGTLRNKFARVFENTKGNLQPTIIRCLDSSCNYIALDDATNGGGLRKTETLITGAISGFERDEHSDEVCPVIEYLIHVTENECNRQFHETIAHL